MMRNAGHGNNSRDILMQRERLEFQVQMHGQLRPDGVGTPLYPAFDISHLDALSIPSVDYFGSLPTPSASSTS